MKKEIKISLPLYKIVYAVFCADTYAQEIVSSGRKYNGCIL